LEAGYEAQRWWAASLNCRTSHKYDADVDGCEGEDVVVVVVVVVVVMPQARP
jgi:hypothetical protein